MERQLVIFNLADEYYGVDIAAVEGIVKMQAITAVPHAPRFVEGVTNLRGKVLPVIELRKRLGLTQGKETKDSRIVTVDVHGMKVGMVVDGVSEVLRVPEEAVEPPSPIVATDASAFITGIAKMDGRLILLLDLARVLTTDEQAQLAMMPPVA